MKRKKVLPISVEELAKYPTKRLLARLETLHQCEESFELSDRRESEFDSTMSSIEFKETIEWQNEYRKLKDILKIREDISKK